MHGLPSVGRAASLLEEPLVRCKWTWPVLGVVGGEVDEAHAVVELERGVAQSGRLRLVHLVNPGLTAHSGGLGLSLEEHGGPADPGR